MTDPFEVAIVLVLLVGYARVGLFLYRYGPRRFAADVAAHSMDRLESWTERMQDGPRDAPRDQEGR